MTRALALVLFAACSDPSAPATDAGVDSAPGCALPALDAPWLADYLDTTLRELAQTPRFTTSERAAARAILAQHLTALGLAPSEHAFSGGANVVATIPATSGSDSEIIVGAHFDTVMSSPGANDNASGTVVVLAVARYLLESPCRTRPVTVALFDLEETGLFGSRAYAQTKLPAAVHSVHTIDQVSWDADGDRVLELEAPTADLETAWRASADRLDVTLVTTQTEGTDHQSFRDRGFAAVGLTEEYIGGDTSPHRHLASDTVTTVDADYLALATQLTADVILRLATD